MDQRAFKNIKSAKDAHYKRSHIHALTRQMLRYRNARMEVTSSRGYGRKEYATSKQTEPSMHKRRYSIDVTTVDGWGRKPTTNPLSTSDSKKPDVAGRHEELEPVASQRETIPLPNPLRHASLQRRRVMHPPTNNAPYLALEESSLSNKYFNCILDYKGIEAWMDDSIINMALECLRRHTKCSSNGIDIINTNLVQSILMFAMTDDTQSSCSDFIRTRLQDKRWILIPVNDAMGSDSYDEDRHGTHWYLVLVDRVRKHMLYYDSMGMDDERYSTGGMIAIGLLDILGEDKKQWSYLDQEHSPCQWDHNQFAGDRGACGPFVFRMVEWMIFDIMRFRDEGNEDDWSPQLQEDFGKWWKTVFHSLDTRWDMQLMIAHYRCVEDSARAMEEHDRVHGSSS